MSTIASQITSLTIVYSTVYSGADQSKRQSSASLAFVWGIHRSPVNSPHKWPVTRKMFPFDDVIIRSGENVSMSWCQYVGADVDESRVPRTSGGAHRWSWVFVIRQPATGGGVVGIESGHPGPRVVTNNKRKRQNSICISPYFFFIACTLRGPRPISGRTYFRHICCLGVNFMQLWIFAWNRVLISASGSLPRLYSEFMYAKLKIVLS